MTEEKCAVTRLFFDTKRANLILTHTHTKGRDYGICIYIGMNRKI